MPPLTEITESYTFIADDFNSAGTLPISEGTMLDNGKVYSPAGNNAATNKKSSEINGASHLNSMRLKGAQNSLVFKTAVDVAVTVYGNAHDSRVYAAGTTNGGVELGKGQTGSGVFTFNASAGTTVYLTAVNDADNSGGDLFIAGFTVEPTANAAAEDGAVQYLIPEGDVVTVDATPDTAGLYPIVTVKGADGQDIAVSDNKFTMPGQNVTTEVTFGDAPATATPAPTATVSPEPTATATVAPPTATPVFPSYANWNIGQAKIDTTDGAAAEVVYPAEGGKAAIEVTSRNIYTTLDQEVSAGQANVSLDVYIDPAVPKNFRIYLESGTENYQNPNGEYVFAEVANNNNLSVNYGPNPAEENKLFDYSQMTAGWYKFNITLDYEGTDFITLEVKAPDGTVAGTAKMGAIAGKSTALRQVRLIQTAAAAQFADMAITVSGQPTATPAPSTPSPTAVPVSSIVVPANDLTLDGGAVLSDNAGQNYTWTEKATDEMKSTFGDPIDSVNTAKFALMNGDGRNVSKTINIPADGEYKLMVMSIEYNNRYFTASVDNGAAIEPESQTPGKMATNNAGGSNVDLTVTEYNLGTLTNGEHTVKVTSAANNSRNILAIAVVPVAAPATPDPSATPEPNKYIATVNVTGGTAVLKDAEGNVYPTYAPEATVAPTVEPTAEPSDAPTAEPSDAPTDEPAATATTAPVTPVTYKYTSTSEIKGGNLCEGDTCTFVDEASEEIRTLFADGSDAAKVAPALTANYKNYVGGTGSKASQPYIEGINLEPGTYNVYYLGYNNEVAIDATIGDISFSIPAASGVPVAREDNNASRVLKAYKFTFTAETALTNATLTFNTTEQWLPDIFSVILTNTTVAANAAGVDGAVQYLIPEGDVVKVDATAETAGQVASVTVTGADGQDVKVENNKFTMPGQNVTADITFAEAPATATPEATAAPTAKPAEVMIAGDMTLNGSAKVYNDAPKEPTAAYTEEYSNIFGENFSKAGTSKVGFLGSNFGGYVTKNYTIDETGSYKAYIMVSYAQNNNQFALSKDGTQVVQGTLVDKSEKVGTNGQDLFIYTYDIDNLEAGTYEFKYYSELGQCSDFVAAAIVAAEAPATATPAPATETPAPSATAMPIDDYIKANLDDVNSQLVDGDVQYAQLVPNYDNSTVDVEVLDGTIKNMSVVKSIEAAIGLVNKYDPVAKYAVHYDGSDYATVSAANEAATNFDTVDNRPDGYKNYNPVTVFGKDDSPSAIAIGKAVSASLGLNTEQFNSISTTDLATFLGYLEANSKYSVNVTAYGADGNSIFTYKFTFADKQPAPSATAEPTAEPTVTPTATPLVVTADEMTLFGQVSRSSFTSFSDPTEYYTEEYSSLFGQNFEKAGTSKIAFNAGSGASCSYEFSISEAGSYVFYFMGATNLGEGGKFTLTRGSTTIVDGKDLVNSQVFGKLNEQNSSKDILIAKYQFNDLEEGNYKITMRPTAGSWGGTLNNRDFVALAIAKTETPQTTATPEPTAEPTEAPTAEPTAEPTEAPTMAPVTIVTAESGMSTSNGGKTADVAFKDITADYTGVYPVIFGENLSKAGAKKMGFLGGSSHNYTTMSYEIPEDGLYKVYMLVYNPNNGNSMSLTKSGSSTPAFDAHLIDMSPQLASASDGYAIKALTYTVALTAGTYTAKYYRTDTSFCSDPIAFAIAPVSEAAANAATVNVTDVAGASAELLDSNGIAYEGDIPEGDVVEIKTSDVTGYAVSVSVTAGGIQIPLTADNKFIMPNQAVTVDVVYNALRSVSVSATGGSVELYNAADNSVIDPANYNSIPEGTVIGITATPDVAEQVAEITVVGATLDTDKNLFTVGDSNVEVTVEFVTPTKYNVNLDAYTNGSVSSDKATAAEGEKVTLTVTPNSGYVTQEVYVVDETQAAETITSTDITKYTFTMPAYDVTIGAIFAQVTGYVEYLFDGSHNTSINSTTAPAITYQGGTHPTPVFTLTNTSKSYGVATALDIKGKLPLSGTSISWNKKASKGSNGAGYFIDLGLVDSYADQNCQIFTMLSPNSVADTTIAKLEGANAGKFGTITAAAAMAEGVFRGIDASDAQADGTIKLTYGNKQGLVYYIAIAYYTPVVQ